MRNNKIKEKLNYRIPKYDAEAFERTLILAKGLDYGMETHRMTEIQSAVSQVKFIPIKAWLFKIIIACLLNASMLFEIKDRNTKLWVIMSIFIPLLCLVSTNEIYNIIQPNLKELLMTARYSIKKIILIRLILFGITDFLILMLSIMCAFILKFDLGWNELLYVIALYNLMCAGCTYILNHIKETNAIFACSAWGGSLAIMNLIISNTFGELIIGKINFVLLFIILLSIWKTLLEIKNMLGGLQKSEASG